MKRVFRVYTLLCAIVGVISVAFVVIGMYRLFGCGGEEKNAARSSVPVVKREFREAIEGDFNGDGAKESAELYRLLQGEDYEYNVHFGDDAIKELDSKTLVYRAKYMTNEGDLNCDGADEIGLFLHGGDSYWGTYTVYTYSKGEWRELVSIAHNPGWVECDMQELVRRNPIHSHCVIVKEINLDFPDMQERVVDLRRHK